MNKKINNNYKTINLVILRLTTSIQFSKITEIDKLK